MAKGQYLSNYQQKIVNNYYNNRDTIFVTKLATIVSDLALTKDVKETGRLWAKAKEFLAKTSANPTRVAKLLSEKNLEELAKVVNDLSNAKPGTADKPAAAPSSSTETAAPATEGSPATPTAIAPETLKSALTAFKKRLKLTVLNDESRLAPRPMTGGKKSEISAIIPPDQFPREVWDELAKQGKLRYTGQGFFELLPGA